MKVLGMRGGKVEARFLHQYKIASSPTAVNVQEGAWIRENDPLN